MFFASGGHLQWIALILESYRTFPPGETWAMASHAQQIAGFGAQMLASHLGGTRDPMVVSWPNRIKSRGGLRSQFTHVIDIGPTILEAAGIPEPKVVDGIEQEPMDGTSFLHTFDDANAEERRNAECAEEAQPHGFVFPWRDACQKPNNLEGLSTKTFCTAA